MAGAQASFAVGEWDDAVPALMAGGQAAQEKGQLAPRVTSARYYQRSQAEQLDE